MYGKGQFNKTAFNTSAGDAASLYATIQNEYGTVVPGIRIKVQLRKWHGVGAMLSRRWGIPKNYRYRERVMAASFARRLSLSSRSRMNMR